MAEIKPGDEAPIPERRLVTFSCPHCGHPGIATDPLPEEPADFTCAHSDCGKPLTREFLLSVVA